MKEEMPKILYIGGFELPDLNAAAHRVNANIKIFKSLGYKVITMGVSHGDRISNSVFETEKRTDYGMDYKVKYPVTKIKWFKYLCNISDIIRVIKKNDIKLVVAYNFPAVSLYRLFLYCRKNDIRLIADCTEWEVSEGSYFYRKIKNFDTDWRMRFLNPRLDGIIAISKYLFDFYSSKNNNVILVPPLVDLNESKWNKNDCIVNNRNILRIAYAGRPGYNKDHLGNIVSALSIIAENGQYDFIFDVIGITLDEYNYFWKENPIVGDLSKNIVFHGRISNKEVIQIIKNADYTIFIRDNNLKNIAGFPTKFVESISCGTPVLTNDISDISNYLKDGINGYYLENSSIEQLSNSIDIALSKPREKIDEMKKNCYSYKGFYYIEFHNVFEKCFNNLK